MEPVTHPVYNHIYHGRTMVNHSIPNPRSTSLKHLMYLLENEESMFPLSHLTLHLTCYSLQC